MPSCLKIYVIDDAMFLSLAEQRMAEETMAVLLTGMGADGAVGLSSMYKQGDYSNA